MKKFFSLIAAVLFAGSMMAGSYTIVFKSTAGADGSASLTSTTVADYITDGAEYVSAIEPAGKVYNGQNGYGLKFGNSSNAGSVTMTLATPIKPTSIVMNASPWSATEGAGLLQDAEYETKSTGAKGTFADFTYEYDGNTEVSTIIVGTKSKRGYVKSVTVNFEGEIVEPMVYYLVGTMNNWEISDDYKLVANPGNTDELMVDVKLPANSQMKVKGVQGETITWFPDGMGNDFVINDAGYYTIYFRADGQGGEGWHYGFIYAQNHPLINCAAAAELAKDEKAYLNEVLVTYVNGGNIYIKDESGYELIYANSFGLAAGDVVNGFVGKASPYHNMPELIPTVALADLEIVHGEAPAPEEITAAPTVADVNKYLVIKGVSLEGEFTTSSKTSLTATIGEETFSLYNNFKVAYSFEEGKTYDIVGVGSIYDENIQLYFVSASEHQATAISNTDADAKAVKFFENGQLIIIKNGVRYNAQGAIVK